MNALIFVLIAIVLALIILLFCKLAALSSHYDDLMDKVFSQEEVLREHTQHFEMHHEDIASNQKAINEIKDNHIRALTTAHDKLDKRLSAVEKIEEFTSGAHIVGDSTSTDDTAETDAEDEPTERQARQPYPPSVREMAEKFIIAEYSTTSIKTIAKLLNIPRATVQRWTKQLIKRGAIQPKKQPTQE